ncbi:thymidine phosphorylase [Lentilitoribacter sp. Alg239-R112]|uniref:thymidine phosphorylase n=1 Tax=Lentilitoribacter sp. Alg239-R112 TaxID=2305987 RepID=UPI0013A6B066|nr:thymidine phosphorylase [Lentilitoribacter sp. Alg239-R112]
MSLLPQELIRKKRDGLALDRNEISQFVQDVTNGNFSDSQVAAMTMAIFLNGMDRDETVALTSAMCKSGDVLNWAHLDGPVVDKHSTGGVGDNVSLMLAPLAAACGLYVPMISGRGLGHTGGTLDKLEAIPGYNVSPSPELFNKVVKEVGCAIISASKNLTPADKKIYAIRDVSATVESIPLIVASILSKKLASGLDALILDVKCGNGSTTSDVDEAELLAQELVDVANGAGLSTKAVITDMNQPLASAIGNAIEINNAIEFLKGSKQDVRLRKVVLEITSSMLVAGGLATNKSEALIATTKKLEDGSAADVFGRMVYALGGPSNIIERTDTVLPVASAIIPIKAKQDGWISSYETRDLGMAVVRMGGGRSNPQDTLDYAVGLSELLPIGQKVSKGDQIALAHINDDDGKALQFEKEIYTAIRIGDQEVDPKNPILSEITASE